jgi:glycosyltransferase involved in cell wall biosynthesis
VNALHHFVATYEPGAIGAHIREMQRLCHELGWASEVYTEHLRGLPGRDFRDYARDAAPGDVLVYHTAIGSPVADFVAGRPERLVVNHHNVTPAAFFAAWEPPVVHGLAWGRAQMAALAARSEIGIADSSFNEGELREVGFRRTSVVPILFDLAQLDREIDAALVERLRAEGPAWLFVGRIAPNKCHHDLIKAFSVYRRVYDADARLRIVGASASDRYLDALRLLVSALQLDDAVTFTGPVSGGELAAHYAAAGVYVCVSEHEGFCVPLLEAMHHDVPVIAFDAGAVAETLGDGGLCLRSKEPSRVAAAADRVRRDPAVRESLVTAGRAQLATFALERTRARMTEALQALS